MTSSPASPSLVPARPAQFLRGLPCGNSLRPYSCPGFLWLLALKTPCSLCTFYRSFMNNWEVYKLLAHVRPPVSKVLATCPSPSVSLHAVLPTVYTTSALPYLCPHCPSVLGPWPCVMTLLAIPDTSPVFPPGQLENRRLTPSSGLAKAQERGL